jgi:hypothetical protein
MTDEIRIRGLLEEATVDCYGEEEEFAGVLVTLQENLSFPLRATLAGTKVIVEEIDSQQSSLQRGIVATVKRNEEVYRVSLADLEFVDPDLASAEWLAMYRWWVGTP